MLPVAFWYLPGLHVWHVVGATVFLNMPLLQGLHLPSSLVDPVFVVADALSKECPMGHVLFVMLWHVASFRNCPAGQLKIQQSPFMRALVLEMHGGLLLSSVVVVLQPTVAHV